MTNHSSLVSVPIQLHGFINSCVLSVPLYLCISLNSGCTEIQEVLKLLQAGKSNVEDPVVTDKDVSSHEDSPSGTDITVLLKEIEVTK